jgi:hypothetical protein
LKIGRPLRWSNALTLARVHRHPLRSDADKSGIAGIGAGSPPDVEVFIDAALL